MRYATLALYVGLSVVVIVGCSQTASSPEATSNTSSPNASSPRAASSGQAASKSEDDRYPVKVASAEGKPARPLPAPSEEEPDALPSGEGTPLIDGGESEELTMPQVFLSEGHAQLCRVQVGDAFPDLELPDLESQQQKLSQLMGKKLTVVVFWNGSQPMALEELADMGPRIMKRFSGDDVAVVGINTGDDPQLALELAGQAGARFVNLSDRDGAALDQVGTGKIPRTYLVDASGKIVWFDIEYSRTTRRELAQAIRFLLAQQ